MVDFQIPPPGLARDFNQLTQQEKDFIAYFSNIDMESIAPVVDCYAAIGPRGYNGMIGNCFLNPQNLKHRNQEDVNLFFCF